MDLAWPGNKRPYPRRTRPMQVALLHPRSGGPAKRLDFRQDLVDLNCLEVDAQRRKGLTQRSDCLGLFRRLPKAHPDNSATFAIGATVVMPETRKLFDGRKKHRFYESPDLIV